MQRRTLIHTAALAAAAFSTFVSLPATAQGTWPTGKPITYMVPFAAGGTTDTLARLIGQQLGTGVISVSEQNLKPLAKSSAISIT